MTSALPSNARGVGIAGTAIAHGALVMLMIIGARGGAVKGPSTYEVTLIAAPMPSAGSRTADATKEPAPKAVTPPPPPVKPKEVPKAQKPPAVQPKRADPTPLVKTPVAPAVGEKPSTGTDAVTLHQAGLVFEYPEYLRNIENKINRHWNHAVFRPGLEVRIAFVISKDGTVPQASVIVEKASGNLTFDENARAAIESVSSTHEFGPLPDGFNGVTLPILFVFKQVARSGP